MTHHLALLGYNRTFLVWLLVLDVAVLIILVGTRLPTILERIDMRWHTWHGKRVPHEFDLWGSDPRFPAEDPRGAPHWWSEQRHVHRWPEFLPWPVVHRLDPLRVRWCEHSPRRAAVGTTSPDDPPPQRRHHEGSETSRA